MIRAMKKSVSRFFDLRGIRIHVREWGAPGKPMLFMLHGWSDVAATFQFVVDALERDWHVIAPDWRGHGASGRGLDAYWFAEYLGDLDALLRTYSPDAPVRIVAHSMGGNVAQMYAGIRPERVQGLVVLEALGRPDWAAENAPERYRAWLDQIAVPRAPRRYADAAALAVRLRRAHPHLTSARARFLAESWTEPDGEGGVRIAIEPALRNAHPLMHRRAEAEACWRKITAPVLWLLQEGEAWRESRGLTAEDFARMKACFKNLREIRLSDCGHNMQHDLPERVAVEIETFFADPAVF